MIKLKVLTVVGTRPELIRLSRVIYELDLFCDHTLVHTGQNYDYKLNQVFFEDLDIRKPDFFLEITKDSNTLANTIGNLITNVDKVLEKICPDAILVLGDTNSCLSVIPAKRRRIPIFHMEAGNRCFDQRVPEETNRKIVDHVADINLTYSSIARDYLIKEGFPSDQIIKTGSPMYEVLNFYLPKIKKSNILEKLNLKKDNYFLVSTHREENIETKQNFERLFNMLNSIANEYKIPLIISTHPRTRKKLEHSNFELNKNIKLIEPLGFHDYINLQMNAKVVLSDSGTISEESSILNFAAINIREAHERPEAMEEAAVMLSGLEKKRVIQCINILNEQKKGKNRDLNLVSDYKNQNVSKKIVRLIHSYTSYINQRVWYKDK